MVGSHGQGGVVSEEANDVKVGHARLDHHDVSTLRLIQASFPKSFPIVGWVLLVGLLVGWDDAALLPCSQSKFRDGSLQLGCKTLLQMQGTCAWPVDRLALNRHQSSTAGHKVYNHMSS